MNEQFQSTTFDRVALPIQFREEAVEQFVERSKTAKQEIKAREGLRKLQDKILSHPASKKFAEDHGEHHPIFEGGPSTAALRVFVHPAHQTQLERLHNQLYGS